MINATMNQYDKEDSQYLFAARKLNTENREQKKGTSLTAAGQAADKPWHLPTKIALAPSN